MRITFLIYENGHNINGPIVNQKRIITFFTQIGHTIQALCLFHDCTPVLDSLNKDLGIKVNRLPSGKDTKETIYWILNEVNHFSPNIFITDWIAPGWYASRWLSSSGIPCIGSLQSDDQYFWSLMRRFVGKTAKSWKISGVWCLSQKLKNELRKKTHVHGTLTSFIPSGVPFPKEIQPKVLPIKMAYVGRIEVRQKQILKTVKAMCHASRVIPNVRGVLFGNGPDENLVRELIISEGCQHKISLHGAVSPHLIQDKLREFNILVLLSDYEGTPAALLDGMAMGLVPVCLHCPGGIEEVVRHEQTGIIVPDREEGFVSALMRIANDPKYLQRLSDGARALIESEYTLSKTIDRWHHLFDGLLATSSKKREIQIPKWISLPPIDPDMAGFDFRNPTRWEKLFGKLRVLLGRIRRAITA